ncbi:MAG: 4Fe-4S dicluster domain-containing protein, partial [Pseudomonadota bacterium]
CIYMCPWPRIQGAMLDENSLLVTYKDWRGEPRGKHRKAEGADELGDCVDCNACVNVCPTGVDIREGQQIGCITCALCIDACDDIMKKIGKPRGLIDYCTLNDARAEAGGAAPEPMWKKLVRPRTILYFLLWSSIGVAMVVMLFMRQEIGLTVAPERNPVYVQLSDGSVRNSYDLKIQNMTDHTAVFQVGLRAGYHVAPVLQGLDTMAVEVGAAEQRRIKLYLTAPAWRARPEEFDVRIWIENQTTRERTFYDTQFKGPPNGIGP